MDWDIYARLYHEMYRLKSLPDHMAAHCEYGRIVVDASHNPLPPAAEPGCNVDISSIGVVDKWVRSFYGLQDRGCEVHALSIGVEMLTRQGDCFV